MADSALFKFVTNLTSNFVTVITRPFLNMAGTRVISTRLKVISIRRSFLNMADTPVI
jgi:hypothetical protein